MGETGDRLNRATVQWLHEYAAQGIFTTDTSLRIGSWNRWLTHATGVQDIEAIGKHLFDVLPSFRERGFNQYYEQALRGTVTVLSYSIHRFVLPSRSDEPRTHTPQSGRIAPLMEAGTVVGTITIVEDVAERVATERELRAQIATSEAARRTAEAASRVKDEFLATLSHEIRTPLNAVLGWTRILRSREVDSATLARAVEIIDRNASAQLTLISDMLDMSRIAAGKLRLDVAPVDLQAVATSAVDVVRPAADAKGVTIDMDLAPHLPPVSGDSDRLTQVVWNLLSNAVKFTDRGGVVRVALESQPNGVMLQVSDTGQGIAPEFLPHVFERFRQADPSASRRHGGLGIGLALVRELVELHGGSVAIVSPGRGKGTTVTVTLPARIKSAADGKAPLPTGVATLAGVRVLLVDDQEDAREILVQSLLDFDASVTAVGSAEEALEYLRDHPEHLPHVVLTDIGMPGLDGYAFIESLRRLPRDRGGEVPVIAVTAYATPGELERCDAAGFKARLEKPVAPLALAAAVVRVTTGILSS